MVHEVMTPGVLCCSESDEVEEAALIMQKNQVRRILVLNEANELVGITSLGELATITGDRLAGETLKSVSEESRVLQEEDKAEKEAADGDSDTEAELLETRVTGLLHDREAAKKVIDALKGAGFTERSIFVGMQDESEQESFVRETQAQAIAGEDIPSLPEFSSGQVLIIVDAEERAADALEILNRNHAVTGGVRIPSE